MEDSAQRTTMLDLIARNWWVFLIRGLVSILFGLTAIIWPGLTLIALVWLFGVYAIIDGVASIWSGFTNRNRHDRWWVEILIGIAGIVAGVLVVALPGLSALALMYFIATWMIIIGVLLIVFAIRMRQEIANEWLLGISGLLSVILGIIFLIFPGSGALSLVFWIGSYAILSGILLIAFAFRLRRPDRDNRGSVSQSASP